MILKRLVLAFRRQDWFTVIIEILIVVIGIFLGLQVTNWNDARQEREAEKLILARLEADFEQILVQGEESAATIDRAVQAGVVIRQRIAGGEAPDDISTFCQAMEPVRAFRPAPPPSPTYTQLVANGEMSLIRPAAVRDALVEFEIARRNHEVRYQAGVDTSLAMSRVFWRAVRMCDLAQLGNQPKFFDATRAMIETPEFAADFSGLVVQQENSARAYINTIEKNRHVLNVLRGEGK